MVRLVAFFLSAQLLAFLVGGIPFAYLLARWRAGVDIRTVGSGNVGATNVGRLLGLPYFLLAFVLDLLKGALPALAALWLKGRPELLGFPDLPALHFLPEVVGFATILGHLFPVYLNLRGGKGVATTIGVLAVLAPVPLVFGLAVWVLLLLASRMVSVASIGFAVAFPLSFVMTTEELASRDSLALGIFISAVSMLIVLRHWSNIGRIIQGTESQVRFPWSPS